MLASGQDILAQLEAPIIRFTAIIILRLLTTCTHSLTSVLTERLNLATDPSLYAHDGVRLLQYIAHREQIAAATGRFSYGKLEYPFTLPIVFPDKATVANPFSPGRFHQDTFSGNANITAFYINTLAPLLNSSTSFFYHLDNSTTNDDVVLNLDATLFALLSHR